ncbi:MAG: HU family DNA-binding protein [Bacilli bacterium]
MAKLNKRDLVDAVALEAGLSKKDTEAALDALFLTMEKALVEGKEINVVNFGVFSPKTRAARTGTHPRSHEKIEIAQSHSVVFRLSKTLKEKL